MLNKKLIFLVFNLFLLAGCIRAPEVTVPASTPLAVRLDITPGSTWILPAVNQCQQETPGLMLSVHEVYTRQLDPIQADVLILSGEPDLSNSYALEIAKSELVFIVNPKNPVQAISDQMLKDIFSSRVRLWSEVDPSLPNEPIVVWIPPTGDEVWDALDSTLIEWQSVANSALIAPDPESMLTSVSKDEYAIGMLPQALANDSVKVIDNPSKIITPIIAVTKSEPQGLLRDLLLCLQTNLQP